MNKDELIKKRDELFKKQKIINSQLSRNYNQIKNLIEKEDQEKIKNWNDNWDWLLFRDGNIESKIKNEFRDNKLYSLGLYAVGYSTNTNQVCLQISKYSKNFYSGLIILLQYIKYENIEKLKKEFKIINILDKDCAAHGKYSLLIISPDLYLIYKEYFKNEIVCEFKSLREACDWIEKNLLNE